MASRKGQICVYAFPKGANSDVWSDEDLRAHLWKTLVARPVQNRLQDLWQHEAAWATDWGIWQVFHLQQLFHILCFNSCFVHLCWKSIKYCWCVGRNTLKYHNTIVNLPVYCSFSLRLCCALRKQSGWPPPATMHFMPSVMSSPNTLSPSMTSCWMTFWLSSIGVCSKVSTQQSLIFPVIFTFLQVYHLKIRRL